MAGMGAAETGVEGNEARRGRNVAWWGKERGGLDAGGATRMGNESRMVGHGYWRRIQWRQA